MTEPKKWNEFAAWADREARDPTSSLYEAIKSLRQANKACDGSAFVAALKKFGAVCYIQGLVDAGWRPPPNEIRDDDIVKQCIDKVQRAIERITAEQISRVNQN